MSPLRIAHPSVCQLWSWDCTDSLWEEQDAAGNVLQNSKLGCVATWILTGREDLRKTWTIYVKVNSAFSLYLKSSSLWSVMSWTEVKGRSCSQFFKSFRRSQLSVRINYPWDTLQRSQTRCLCVNSERKSQEQDSKTKAACPQYGWEGGFSNGRGITPAHFEGHWKGTNSTPLRADSKNR